MVGFNSLRLEYMSAVNNLAPNTVFRDRQDSSDVDADIRIAKEKGIETLVIRHDGITAEKISKIHTANLKAGAWTIDNAAEMEMLEKMGIDHIYTDDPKLRIRVKKKLQK